MNFALYKKLEFKPDEVNVALEAYDNCDVETFTSTLNRMLGEKIKKLSPQEEKRAERIRRYIDQLGEQEGVLPNALLPILALLDD